MKVQEKHVVPQPNIINQVHIKVHTPSLLPPLPAAQDATQEGLSCWRAALDICRPVGNRKPICLPGLTRWLRNVPCLEASRMCTGWQHVLGEQLFIDFSGSHILQVRIIPCLFSVKMVFIKCFHYNKSSFSKISLPKCFQPSQVTTAN